MNVQYSDIAVGSNPTFSLTLKDVETTYLPEAVYYQVQAQKSDTLEWQDVGTVQKLKEVSSTFKIILPTELTSTVEGCNLTRRLIVEVYYNDGGQTVHSTQVLQFDLQPLPVLQTGYVPPSPTTFDILSNALSGVGNCQMINIEANAPIEKVQNARVTCLIDEQPVVLPIEANILAGNSSILAYWQQQGLPTKVEMDIYVFETGEVYHYLYEFN